MAEKLCPTCLSWLCAADDAFCGACGNACASLRLEAWPAVLLIGHRPPDLIFKLYNGSCAALAVSRTEAPDWVEWSKRPEGTVPAGGMCRYEASGNTRALTAAASADVVILTTGGTVSTLLMAIPEKPVMRAVPEEVSFWPAGPHTSRQIRM